MSGVYSFSIKNSLENVFISALFVLTTKMKFVRLIFLKLLNSLTFSCMRLYLFVCMSICSFRSLALISFI